MDDIDRQLAFQDSPCSIFKLHKGGKNKKKKVITITKDTELLLPSSLFHEHSPFTFHIINHVFCNRIKASTEATHQRQMGNVRLKSQVGMLKYKKTHGLYNFFGLVCESSVDT